MWISTRSEAEALDSTDELAELRCQYQLPPDLIRLDGSNGGPLPGSTPARLRRFVEHRWDCPAGRPSSDADWRAEARRAAAGLAPLLGAAPEEISVVESTSMALFQALLAAARLRPDQPVLAVGRDCNASEHYLARSAAEFAGAELRMLSDVEELRQLPRGEVAAVALSHADLDSCSLRDVAAVTAEIHRLNALAVWDLSHSAGAVEVDLHGWNVDFAIGCGYRFLGGGPGAPAYCFATSRHRQLLRGRSCTSAGIPYPPPHGHPAAASSFVLAGITSSLSILDGVPPAALHRKTQRMTDLFRHLLDEQGVPEPAEVVRAPSGAPTSAQVDVRHPDAQLVVDRLLDRGVVADFAEPDRVRFSFAPVWLRYVDVWEAAQQLTTVLHQTAQVPAHPRPGAVKSAMDRSVSAGSGSPERLSTW